MYEKNFQKVIMMAGNKGRHNAIYIRFQELLLTIVEYVGGLGIGDFDLP